jgi:hypothetical protein
LKRLSNILRWYGLVWLCGPNGLPTPRCQRLVHQLSHQWRLLGLASGFHDGLNLSRLVDKEVYGSDFLRETSSAACQSLSHWPFLTLFLIEASASLGDKKKAASDESKVLLLIPSLPSFIYLFS